MKEPVKPLDYARPEPRRGVQPSSAIRVACSVLAVAFGLFLFVAGGQFWGRPDAESIRIGIVLDFGAVVFLLLGVWFAVSAALGRRWP
jgi:hypothetical protein